jgi:hypothetical protein
VQEKTFALSSTSRNDAENIAVAVAILRQVGWSLNADADHELQKNTTPLTPPTAWMCSVDMLKNKKRTQPLSPAELDAHSAA